VDRHYGGGRLLIRVLQDGHVSHHLEGRFATEEGLHRLLRRLVIENREDDLELSYLGKLLISSGGELQDG
jgi:hypothetical protein